MISAQIDKLRQVAQVYRNLGKHATEQMLLDAADTIWELRESVHRERDEADTLRASNEVIAEDNAALCEQNAKLRGLVRDVYALHWSGLDCTECPWIGECDTDGGCPWLGIMRDHMRELGVVL